MFRQRSDPFERWRGITIEYLLLPGLTAYLYAVLWQKGNLYLIFMLYFMFFFISSLISLLSSLCLRYMIFGYPVKQIIKRMLRKKCLQTLIMLVRFYILKNLLMLI